MSNYDVVIVGGGIVGLTLACALAKQTELHILVLEMHETPAGVAFTDYDSRVSAISLASQRIFKALNVWPDILQRRISPFNQIEVWDSSNQTRLHFDCKEIAESALGFIIENKVMHSALLQQIRNEAQVTMISPVNLFAFTQDESGITITGDDGRVFKAQLAVAADGANSWLRQQAQIELHHHDYQQLAIVSNVRTTLPHDQIARQIFLPTGPLAFLPLNEPNLCSIVWSLPKELAQQKMELDAAEFNRELAIAFQLRLDEVVHTSSRYSFILKKQWVRQYIQSRVVLLGDAAHTVHPLAGQGLNLGLLDAASLVEVIMDAVQSDRVFHSRQVLRRYERWRKAENMLMLNFIDAIHQLFQYERPLVTRLRTLTLGLTNRIPLIKNFFVRQAVGNRADLPALALSPVSRSDR